MRLDDAVRALRDETNEPYDGADETRSRVVAQLERSRGRRSRRYLVILPIAAVLAAATASAGVAGKLPAAWHSALRVLRLSPEAAPAIEPARPPAPMRDDPAVSPSEASAVSEVPEVSEAPEPRAMAAPAEPRRTPKIARPVASPPAPTASVSTPASPPAASSAPPSSDSLALYRQAHRLHFSAQDHAAALQAWDAYLREDPAGALALEARYNRAICLVRLHRSREAREALAPFADGRLGGYRASEARALLKVLDGDAPGE